MSGRCRTCGGYHPGPHLTARGELVLAAAVWVTLVLIVAAVEGWLS